MIALGESPVDGSATLRPVSPGRRTSRSEGDSPKAVVKRRMIAVRLPEPTVKSLRLQCALRANKGQLPDTMQGVIEEALRQWLERHSVPVDGRE